MEEKEFKDYYDYVFSIALNLSKNRESAKDLTQETMYNAYKNKSSFKNKNIKNYLRRIVTNLYFNKYRKEKNIWFDSVDNIKKYNTNDGLNNLEYKETYKKVFNKLSPKSKESILLRIKGYKNKEIAEEINSSHLSVRSLISSSLKIIRKNLKL